MPSASDRQDGFIQGFKHDRLKKFYADWYRPSLMAVVAVATSTRPRLRV